MVKILEETHQISTLDIRSGNSNTDKGIDALLWNLPVPEGEECTNPCCKRIFAVYGPSYTHKQLNHATHIAMREWFGVINTKSFDQLTTILRKGYAVDHLGKNIYLPEAKKIDIPIHFIAGDQNEIFFPETSLRTYEWLKANGNPDLFSRQVFKNYAHMDFFIGKNAAKDVFPDFLKTLNTLDRER
jgi:pimeloyl-ACP methyl ester carboxylesterase